MSNKKYEFTGETKEWCGHILHRIRAIVDIAYMKAGAVGGWIESESNLSENGNAWVYDNAKVCGNAKVYGNAKVCGNAEVYGNAEVLGNAKVCGNAEVYGNALVCVNAKVCGDAEICGNAEIYGNAEVKQPSDYIVVKNCWSSMRWFTYTRSNKKWKVGCFYGTGEELIKKAYADSETSGKCYEAIVRAVEAIEEAKKED